MAQKLKITLGGESYLADLLWQEAPRTCEAFIAACPFESRIFSAKICDAEVTYPVPGEIADLDLMENPKFEEPAGAVVWYGAWSSICIFFDICEPRGWLETCSGQPLFELDEPGLNDSSSVRCSTGHLLEVSTFTI